MKRIISLALCFLLVFTLCQPVFAAGNTITWTGALNEDWSVVGNWDPAQVPGLGDTAVIPASTVAEVVYGTEPVTLDCSGEVSVESGAHLYLTGTSYLKDSGKLSGDGNITIMGNDSQLQWSGGNIEGNGTFTVDADTELFITGDNEKTFSNPLVNNGQIIVNGELYLYGGSEGTGTFEVPYGGYVSFEEGAYNFGGNFVNGGIIIIQDTSSALFKADYRQENTGVTALRVWGSGSDEYCKLNVDGEAQLDGPLVIDFADDYVPQPGDTFEIMTYSSRVGMFSSIADTIVGITLEPTYNANSLTLTVRDGTVPGENVCEIDGTGYPELDDALATVQSGESKTIRLLKDIDYTSGIVVEDKSITFDLNGYTLNVVNNAQTHNYWEMSGLYVKGNATVALEGEGEFNVTGSWYGVCAECGENGEMPSVTVTNATGIGRDGVSAQSSKVTVRGDVTSNGSGGYGVYASYENAEVTVEGNVYANGEESVGVLSDSYASVTVKGSVIVNGSDSIGVKAESDGDVTVDGNVTVSGSGSIGVSLLPEAGLQSIVTIGGLIVAEKYILFEAEDGSGEEYSFRDGDFDEEGPNYLYYTKDGESFVCVSTFGGGSGTEEDPYLISHVSHLHNFNWYFAWLSDKHYKQIADIDLSGWYSLGSGWRPIGNGEVPFVGSYDGDGHTISNLSINDEYLNTSGMFGVIGFGAEIRNVGLIDAHVTGRHIVGGLVGENYGLITNSYVTGEVRGMTRTGGLIGYNEGSVTDSYFDGTVSQVKIIPADTLEYAGGLVGYNQKESSITGCYADAIVQSEGNYIGGLVGYNLGLITESYAISDVKVGYRYIGGLTGHNSGMINNSYADGDVTGYSCVGGLIGSNSSPHPITDSFFTGTVTASGDYTGGLVGDNSGPISSCHADATVISTGDYAGGLAGSSSGAIMSSYSTGSVTGKIYVGGLVGESYDGSGEISASYSTCVVEGESYVGGLAGSNENNISISFAKGSVTGTENDTGNTYAGGLVGYNTGPISNSYAWGNVSGQDMVGGLIGFNQAGITNCYEIGAVAGDNYTGGLIGYNYSGGVVTSSFWNNNTSGQDSSDGGESKGSVAMTQQATYVNEGWDFDIIWNIEPFGFNDGYPFLRWQRGAEFAGGSGTEEDPYLIETMDQLNNVRNHLDKHFRLTADLDLSESRSGSGWEPIGTKANPFTGSFDGGGHTISYLFIEQDGEWDVRIPAGLFGYTGAEAEIRNLTLENAEVTGCYYVGGLVGNNSGVITNVYVSGDITGEWDTGGLTGFNRGWIIGSGFEGDVTGDDLIEYGEWTGGLVGYNIGTITRCWADAIVFSEGDDIGGLVGENYEGTITESYSSGIITGEDYIGGLAGNSTGDITACYSTCTVNGNQGVGGLAGANCGPIAYSFAVGIVEGDYKVGGLVGVDIAGIVTSCYWDTEKSGQSTSGGGTGKTTANMKQPATFQNWDFITIWDIDAGFNDGYPFLRWQIDAPPVLSETGVDSVTDTTATLSFTSNKSGTYYYLVYDAAEDAPDAAIIKAQGEGAAAKGSGVAAAAANTVVAAGLTASTAYNAYIIVEYAEGNTSNVAVISFTTETVPGATVPTAPQNFTATPGDGQVALSWTAPASDGGSAIIRYEVSSDNGTTWVTASNSTSHTFTGLTNGTAYTFKVRAVNSIGNGAEASTTATPTAPAHTTYTVNFYSNGSLYASKTVTGGSALGTNWPANPMRSGYSFGGWFTGQNGTGTQYTSATIITADVDLYAKWTHIGSIGSGGGGSDRDSDDDERRTPTAPTTPAYKADIIVGNTTKMTLPVTVDTGVGNVSIEEDPWNTRTQGSMVINMPSIPGVGTYSVGIQVPDLSTSDVMGRLTVNTDAGSVTIPSNMLAGTEHVNGNKAQISISKGDKSALPNDVKTAIGDRPLIKLTLSIDGKQADWNNPNAPVTVSIPYTPTAEELANYESIVVWYIDGSGNVVTIPNGHYNPATGMVTFSTTHFSNFAVAYNKISFNDVTSGAWYARAVSFIAAREITAGTGGGNFSPEAKLTRGQFIVMLMKAYDIAPDANPKENFADAGNTWYTGYLAAAKRLSISNGVGNNMFAPDKEITRQEMFTLLYNVLKAIGGLPEGAAGKPLSAFADAGNIASWANEAMTLLVKTGTIGGSDGKLNPTRTTTRSEMAQVLYNLLSK